jgi:hypothetical protein
MPLGGRSEIAAPISLGIALIAADYDLPVRLPDPYIYASPLLPERTHLTRREYGWSNPVGGDWASLASGGRRIRRLVTAAAGPSVCRVAWLCLIQAQACIARVVFVHGRFVTWGYAWASSPGCLFRAASAVPCIPVAP